MFNLTCVGLNKNKQKERKTWLSNIALDKSRASFLGHGVLVVWCGSLMITETLKVVLFESDWIMFLKYDLTILVSVINIIEGTYMAI